MLSRVDFPEPELPTIKTNSPRFIVNETLSNARTSVSPVPKILVTFLSSNTISDSSHRLHWLKFCRTV